MQGELWLRWTDESFLSKRRESLPPTSKESALLYGTLASVGRVQLCPETWGEVTAEDSSEQLVGAASVVFSPHPGETNQLPGKREREKIRLPITRKCWHVGGAYLLAYSACLGCRHKDSGQSGKSSHWAFRAQRSMKKVAWDPAASYKMGLRFQGNGTASKNFLQFMIVFSIFLLYRISWFWQEKAHPKWVI